MNKKKLIELRCKAWGITEDEYYCNQCSDFSLENMARAYRRGKNKGAGDKAIQNVGFYQKQMEAIYDKKNKQIADLEKENAELKKEANYKIDTLCLENAELKAQVDKWLRENTGLKIHNAYVEKKLTEAKEILQEYIRINLLPPIERKFNDEVKLFKQAEQFLSEK